MALRGWKGLALVGLLGVAAGCNDGEGPLENGRGPLEEGSLQPGRDTDTKR